MTLVRVAQQVALEVVRGLHKQVPQHVLPLHATNGLAPTSTIPKKQTHTTNPMQKERTRSCKKGRRRSNHLVLRRAGDDHPQLGAWRDIR